MKGEDLEVSKRHTLLGPGTEAEIYIEVMQYGKGTRVTLKCGGGGVKMSGKLAM